MNIHLPLKGKKMHHFVLQLLSPESAKSNLNQLDISNSNNNSKFFRSDKSISHVYEDKKLEDIYNEILEQSLNEGKNDGKKEVNTITYHTSIPTIPLF